MSPDEQTGHDPSRHAVEPGPHWAMEGLLERAGDLTCLVDGSLWLPGGGWTSGAR